MSSGQMKPEEVEDLLRRFSAYIGWLLVEAARVVTDLSITPATRAQKIRHLITAMEKAQNFEGDVSKFAEELDKAIDKLNVEFKKLQERYGIIEESKKRGMPFRR